jgi:hypothetical protein
MSTRLRPIPVGVTPDELRQLRASAARAGQPLARYVRGLLHLPPPLPPGRPVVKPAAKAKPSSA